VLIFEP